MKFQDRISLQELKPKAIEAFERIEFMHFIAKEIQEKAPEVMERTKHLNHLALLPEIYMMALRAEQKLLGEATGKDERLVHVLKIFGIIICSLLALVVFLLTGEHFGLINALHK